MSFETGDDINFELPGHWKWYQLDELKADEKGAIISGPFGSNISSKYFISEGVPVIRGNNLSLSFERFIDDGFVFVSEEKAKELNTWAKYNDIIFTAAGTIGQVGIIGENTKYSNYIISNKQIRVRLNSKKILPLFAYYWLASPQMIQYIQQRNTGSTIPLINLSIVRTLPIPLPPINEQEKIVAILSSLDDKIELNHHTNITLETLALNIFKEWFVDFNIPGKTYEMEDSALGMIPKGWRVGKLLDLVDINMGQSPPGESYNQAGDGVIFFQGKAEFGFRFPIKDKYTTSPIKFAQKYDTLLSVRAPVGTINMAKERCCIGRGLAAISGKKNSRSFAFYCLKYLESHFKSYEGTGTVFGSINKTELENINFVVPPDEVIFTFEKVVNQMDNFIFNNDNEIETLDALRNILLYKIMRGELRL